MRMQMLHELLVDELSDLYSAEKQILKALPKMVKAASSGELRQAFEEHLTVTEEHVGRLDQAFELLEGSPKRKKCAGMEGLLEEGKERMKESPTPEVRDAGMIVAAQKVEHYEIAGYGSARTFARLLGKQEIAELLQETLNEEGEADKKLSQIAETVNREAAEGGGEESEESGEGEEEGTHDTRRSRAKRRAA